MKTALREEIDALRWTLGLVANPKAARVLRSQGRKRGGCRRCTGACRRGACGSSGQ